MRKIVLRAACAAAVLTVLGLRASGQDQATENERQRLYAEADRIVAKLLATMDNDGRVLEDIPLGDDTDPRRCGISEIRLSPLGAGSEHASNWVAGVTTWIGLTNVQCSLRAYRREAGGVKLVATTDDTPLVRMAKTKEGISGRGNLSRALTDTITEIGVSRTAETANCWMATVTYLGVWRG